MTLTQRKKQKGALVFQSALLRTRLLRCSKCYSAAASVSTSAVSASATSAASSTSASGGEPEKDLLQLVEHAQSGVDVEVDEGGNGFVETHEMRAMPVGATFLAV